MVALRSQFNSTQVGSTGVRLREESGEAPGGWRAGRQLPAVPAQLAIEVAGVGRWETDPVSGAMLSDTQFDAVVGVREAPRTIAGFIGAIGQVDRARFESALTSAYAASGDGQLDIALRTDSDPGRWIVVNARLVFEGDDTMRLLGTVVRVHDHVLGLLTEARAIAAVADEERRAVDDRLAFVSHELRHPVNAVVGWSRMLLADPVARESERIKGGLRVIARQATAQLRLVDDILDLARSKRGKLQLTMGLVDVHAALEYATRSVRVDAEKKDIALRACFEPDLGSIIGDGDWIAQVFVNLLANAVKFTPHGGRVDFSAVRAASGIVVRVSDSGDGIDSQQLPFVFERFWQAPGSFSIAKGLGLGLAIVRELWSATEVA